LQPLPVRSFQPRPTERPAFLITIDTEGDNAWSRPQRITTENSRFLPRFQSLCERYSLKPTYLTNHEMANCPAFREFAKDVVQRGTGEVGMHLHAWDSPPLTPLTANDLHHHPFLIEYPESVMREKVHALTELLEQVFAVKMTSHRAGRWSFDARYARILVAHGYRVDCSVTPHVSWKATKGDPGQGGGTDYRLFPELPYFLDSNDISRAGESSLLEVPVTILDLTPAWFRRLGLAAGSLPSRIVNRLRPASAWLRPRGGNLAVMRALLKRAQAERRPCVEFMLHSSEFMPGGSPTFPNEPAIEALYEDLETLFSDAGHGFTGQTLTEFHARIAPEKECRISSVER